jgi:hypothetical protein
MGWYNSHLHQFSTGPRGSQFRAFPTDFDLEKEGGTGTAERDVRLDQLLAKQGDWLRYDYDFGDGWTHKLKVEAVLDEAPSSPTCTAGKRACPPEDCGGVWGYGELADWVRSDYDDTKRPEVFETKEDALSWLPEDWHPDVFDVAEANQNIGLLDQGFSSGLVPELTEILSRGFSPSTQILHAQLAVMASMDEPVELDQFEEDDLVRLTLPFKQFLDVIGPGKDLTAAGYLKPADVYAVGTATGIADWWIGRINREEKTWPVLKLREAAQAAGLVSVRKGRLSPTKAGLKAAQDPESLLRFILSKLPAGRRREDPEFGWVALAVVAACADPTKWDQLIVDLLFDVGWRTNAPDGKPFADSPSLDVLEIMGGAWGFREIDPSLSEALSLAVLTRVSRS